MRSLFPRATVRWRLTLLYTLIFLICGAVLLAITYWLFANFAESPPKEPFNPAAVKLAGAMSAVRAQGLHRLQLYSAIALGFMAIVSVVLGWLLAGRVLAPSEAAFEAQRRFVANASHELRTPLAVMRTTLDVAIAKPSGVPEQTRQLDVDLRVDLDHADDLLESFLTLARAQNGRIEKQDHVALEPLLTAALAARADEIAARKLAVDTHLAAVDVNGSATLLARMIENVIENAVRHAQPDGSIQVTLSCVNRVQALVIVDSSGPVLDQDAVGELAQPFKRLRQDRTGSQDGHGLGLSIVAAIVAAHDGRLELQARPEGGLRVQILLPAAAVRALVEA